MQKTTASMKPELIVAPAQIGHLGDRHVHIYVQIENDSKRPLEQVTVHSMPQQSHVYCL